MFYVRAVMDHPYLDVGMTVKGSGSFCKDSIYDSGFYSLSQDCTAKNDFTLTIKSK